MKSFKSLRRNKVGTSRYAQDIRENKHSGVCDGGGGSELSLSVRTWLQIPWTHLVQSPRAPMVRWGGGWKLLEAQGSANLSRQVSKSPCLKQGVEAWHLRLSYDLCIHACTHTDKHTNMHKHKHTQIFLSQKIMKTIMWKVK